METKAISVSKDKLLDFDSASWKVVPEKTCTCYTYTPTYSDICIYTHIIHIHMYILYTCSTYIIGSHKRLMSDGIPCIHLKLKFYLIWGVV